MSYRERTVRATAVREGDYLPDYDAIVVAVVTEACRRGDKAWFALSNGTDVWRYVFADVTVARQRRLAPHVQVALDSYREARHVWEMAREQFSAGYTCEKREYAVLYPPPRFSQFLKHNAREAPAV